MTVTKKATKSAPKKKATPKTSKTASKAAAKPKVEVSPVKKQVRRSYLYAVGRRKSAVARTRYYRKGSGTVMVNNIPAAEYFPYALYHNEAVAPIKLVSGKLEGDFTIKVTGGGLTGQVDAIKLGIARLLVKLDKDNRAVLKKAGFLKRDPRIKERKKFGLKRARRAPQWQKR